MTIAKEFLDEWQTEEQSTRRLLEALPADRLDFRPHDKSWTLGELAQHVANVPGWSPYIMEQDSVDFADMPRLPPLTGKDDILDLFETQAAKFRDALADVPDAGFAGDWTLKASGHTIFSRPRPVVIRSFVLSHLIHHRGQLSVYVRLAGGKVPGMYGPSADER